MIFVDLLVFVASWERVSRVAVLLLDILLAEDSNYVAVEVQVIISSQALTRVHKRDKINHNVTLDHAPCHNIIYMNYFLKSKDRGKWI